MAKLVILAVTLVAALVIGRLLVWVHPDIDPDSRVSIPLDRSAPPPKTAPRPKPPPLPPGLHEEIVDSMDFREGSALEAWTVVKSTGGYVDAVTFTRTPGKALDSRPLRGDDIIQASGWAGHRTLGMRMTMVLFSVCGRIVGAATVDKTRADVARSVHPNLSQSGWSARLAAAHFPKCENMVLKAWAMAPLGALVWPLVGDFPLRPPEAAAAPGTVSFVNRTPLPRPQDIAQPAQVAITVQSKRINLRQCAGTACAIVGKADAGTYNVFVVEKRDGWSLLQFEGVSGWVANSLYAVTAAE